MREERNHTGGDSTNQAIVIVLPLDRDKYSTVCVTSSAHSDGQRLSGSAHV
jgi:hypothetical protein